MVPLRYSYQLLRHVGVGATLLFMASAPNVATAQQVSVPATFHRQEHALSCEIATLKMALGVHNISVSERELIAQLPVDTTPRGGGVWGDPYRAFVGDIDGRMLREGYGVYWDPIAALGKKYAHTTVLQHGSPTQVARAIAAGNPVIIWGYYGPRVPYTWQTPAGTTVHAMDGQHTRLVYGFDGPADAPTRFYLLDPLSGPLTWSTAELMHNWSSFNHMGVIVADRPQWVRVPGETAVWELDADRKIRRWVTTWDTFIERGGSPAAVANIDSANLFKYTVGAPIN